MHSDPTQTTRIAKLKTPVEGDKLVIARFEAEEGLSEIFEYRIDALSPQRNIDFSKSLGRACSVTFSGYRGVERYFNGILVEAQWIEKSRQIMPTGWYCGLGCGCSASAATAVFSRK